MKYYKLDKEEKQILKDFDDGKYGTVSDSKAEIARFEKAAKATLNKTKNINIRLTEKDLHQIKSKAIKIGIPYQTLLTSLIHQYSNDVFTLNF
ncbi:MAG: antitoxin [bacterium]